MATEYKLSYTAEEINESLDKINSLEVTDGIIGENNLPASGVTAGTYGGFIAGSKYYNIPNMTVDKNGRVIEASNSVLKPVGRYDGGVPGLVTFSQLALFECTTGQMYWMGRDSMVYVSNGLSTVKIDEVKYKDSTGVTVTTYVPRILDVHVYVYDDEGDTKRTWVSVPYKASSYTDSKSDTLYTSVQIYPPAEYFDYSEGKMIDGTPIPENNGAPAYLLYHILFEQDPTKPLPM